MNDCKHILVVEDEKELSDLMAEFLRMFGYTVSTAGDGYDALALLETTTIDIVITDVRMPRMDGMNLMTIIKNKYSDLPVIIITGVNENKTRDIAHEKGADAFIAKPFHMRDLKKVVDSMCK